MFLFKRINIFSLHFQNIKSYQKKASFGAWLKKIVVNKAISYLRKQQVDMVELDQRFDLKDNSESDDIDLISAGGFKNLTHITEL